MFRLDNKTTVQITRDCRHRLHGRAFQSKRFNDLETASKTTRFQGVYTEPIQPVKAISFSDLCASTIGARFDQTRVRRLSSARPNPESSLAFLSLLCRSVSTKMSTFQDIFACISAVWLSDYSKIYENHKITADQSCDCAAKRCTPCEIYHIYFASQPILHQTVFKSMRSRRLHDQ